MDEKNNENEEELNHEEDSENDSLQNNNDASLLEIKKIDLPQPNDIYYQEKSANQDTLKLVFKKLPAPTVFSTALNHKSSLTGQTNNQKPDSKPENQTTGEINQITTQSYLQVDGEYSPIVQYYSEMGFPMIFRKFDNTHINTIPYKQERYFSGNFFDVRKFLQETKKEPKDYNPKESASKDTEFLNLNKSNIPLVQSLPHQPFTSSHPIPSNSQHTQLNWNSNPNQTRKKLKSNELIFESSFESGNLFAVFKTGKREYDLVLQNDVNSKGNTQWFYFKVTNTLKNVPYKFNIVNFYKSDSLFKQGMKPLVYSEKSKEKGWFRDGDQIEYRKNEDFKETGNRTLYELAFTLKFQHTNDTVQIAHSYPYTYSMLCSYLNDLETDKERSKFLKRKLLCQTLDKIPCEILTITEPSAKSGTQIQKKQIFVLARQHPGETPGSFLAEGMISFLTDPTDKMAQFLRQNCIFKIVPMVNPDGVIQGNYRCNLEGSDLNRKWNAPRKEYQPTIYQIKSLMLNIQKECGPFRFILDLHGHSKRMNSFFYGNPWEPDAGLPRIYPLVCSRLNPAIKFESSTFKINSDKQSSMRQQMFSEFAIPHIYTFECSFYGAMSEARERTHFRMEDMRQIGRNLCEGMALVLKNECPSQDRYEFDASLHAECQKEVLQKLDYYQSLQNQMDSGSDSDPLGDELEQKEKDSFKSPKKKKGAGGSLACQGKQQRCTCPQHRKQRENSSGNPQLQPPHSQQDQQTSATSRDREYLRMMSQTKSNFQVKKVTKGVQTEPGDEKQWEVIDRLADLISSRHPTEVDPRNRREGASQCYQGYFRPISSVITKSTLPQIQSESFQIYKSLFGFNSSADQTNQKHPQQTRPQQQFEEIQNMLIHRKKNFCIERQVLKEREKQPKRNKYLFTCFDQTTQTVINLQHFALFREGRPPQFEKTEGENGLRLTQDAPCDQEASRQQQIKQSIFGIIQQSNSPKKITNGLYNSIKIQQIKPGKSQRPEQQQHTQSQQSQYQMQNQPPGKGNQTDAQLKIQQNSSNTSIFQQTTVEKFGTMQRSPSNYVAGELAKVGQKNRSFLVQNPMVNVVNSQEIECVMLNHKKINASNVGVITKRKQKHPNYYISQITSNNSSQVSTATQSTNANNTKLKANQSIVKASDIQNLITIEESQNNFLSQMTNQFRPRNSQSVHQGPIGSQKQSFLRINNQDQQIIYTQHTSEYGTLADYDSITRKKDSLNVQDPSNPFNDSKIRTNRDTLAPIQDQLKHKQNMSFSMRHQYQTRQARKILNSPFNQRFVEKLLKQVHPPPGSTDK